MGDPVLTTRNFNAYFGNTRVLNNIDLDIPEKSVMAIMGPSGCGKTTYIRCINRMHELTPDATTDGSMRLYGEDIFKLNPIVLRKKIGMVFQRPNPFPTMSIYDNVISGYKLNGLKVSKSEKENIVEESLKRAALWKEVKDKLNERPTNLSGGQQQRLCLARAVAMKPNILLLDEPTSDLDPISTAEIEELIYDLKSRYTIIMVTHNMNQASRISDLTTFFYMGELIESGDTKQIFTNPEKRETQNYITGRFG
jgi:phosphate transport system ATP-binding protein